MNDTSPLDGLTRSIRSEDLRPDHLGRDFVGVGIARRIIFAGEYTFVIADEMRVAYLPGQRAHYWMTEDEIEIESWALMPTTEQHATSRKEH